MISFRKNYLFKPSLILRIEDLENSGKVIQELGWKRGKGSSSGAAINRFNPPDYPKMLGLPEWIAWLQEAIFLGLLSEDARTWTSSLLSAIPEGVTEDVFEFIRTKLNKNRTLELIEIDLELKDEFKEKLSSILNYSLKHPESKKLWHYAERDETYFRTLKKPTRYTECAAWIIRSIRSFRFSNPHQLSARSAGSAASAMWCLAEENKMQAWHSWWKKEADMLLTIFKEVQ